MVQDREEAHCHRDDSTMGDKVAVNTLKHKDIVEVTAVGHQGIGATNTVLWSRSDQKVQALRTERRDSIHSGKSNQVAGQVV